MDTSAVIIIAVLALLLLLAVGGAIAVRRRREATEDQFLLNIDQANRDLAAAHAADNGWEPAKVEGAARQAFAEQRPGHEITGMALVQVVDPPGTDDDRAVFRVQAGDHSHLLTLGRRGGEWVFETLD
jgi:hypothetical protein